MKTITMVIVWTMALVGMTSSPAQAKDTDIGHHNSGAVSSFCADTPGGTFLEGRGIYGCKWVRDNGAYAVICDQESCFYTTPYRRQTRPSRTGLADVASGRLDAAGSEIPWLWVGIAAVTGIAGFAAGRGTRKRPRGGDGPATAPSG